MNKSKFVALFVALLGLAVSGPAAAQVRVYFGGSVGNTEAHSDACQGAALCDRSDTGYSGNVGMMFNPNWGVELAYRDFGKVVEASDGMGNNAEWKVRSGEAVLVAALPFNQLGLSERFALHGKLGGYYAKTKLTSNYLPEAEKSNRQFTYGFGMSYDVLRHLRLRAEWQRYNNVGANDVAMRADINVMSVGLLLVF